MSVQKRNRFGSRKPGSRNRADLRLRDLGTAILTNPKVQQRLLDQARTGKLPPRLMIEFFRYYGGKPPDRVAIPKPPPTRAEEKAKFDRLTTEERYQLADLLIKMEQPEQPAPTIRPNPATGKSL